MEIMCVRQGPFMLRRSISARLAFSARPGWEVIKIEKAFAEVAPMIADLIFSQKDGAMALDNMTTSGIDDGGAVLVANEMREWNRAATAKAIAALGEPDEERKKEYLNGLRDNDLRLSRTFSLVTRLGTA